MMMFCRSEMETTDQPKAQDYFYIHWRDLVEKTGWKLESLRRWKAEFEKRLDRGPIAWDLKYAALHIQAIDTVLEEHSHADQL